MTDFTKEELDYLHYGLSVAIDSDLLELLEITALRDKIKSMIEKRNSQKYYKVLAVKPMGSEE